MNCRGLKTLTPQEASGQWDALGGRGSVGGHTGSPGASAAGVSGWLFPAEMFHFPSRDSDFDLKKQEPSLELKPLPGKEKSQCMQKILNTRWWGLERAPAREDA